MFSIKKIFFIYVFIFYSFRVFAQLPCPTIVFSYDASGNRIQRALVVIVCGPQRTNGDTIHTMSDTTLALKMKIKVYPNPAQDKITVELGALEFATESIITLSDVSGKNIYSEKTILNNLQIDVSKIASGTYYLKIIRGDDQAVYSVFKN